MVRKLGPQLKEFLLVVPFTISRKSMLRAALEGWKIKPGEWQAKFWRPISASNINSEAEPGPEVETIVEGSGERGYWITEGYLIALILWTAASVLTRRTLSYAMPSMPSMLNSIPGPIRINHSLEKRRVTCQRNPVVYSKLQYRKFVTSSSRIKVRRPLATNYDPRYRSPRHCGRLQCTVKIVPSLCHSLERIYEVIPNYLLSLYLTNYSLVPKLKYCSSYVLPAKNPWCHDPSVTTSVQ